MTLHRWTIQHEYIEKLNMQAVLNASAMEEEFIKEFIITHDKVNSLFITILCHISLKYNLIP